MRVNYPEWFESHSLEEAKLVDETTVLLNTLTLKPIITSVEKATTKNVSKRELAPNVIIKIIKDKVFHQFE